MKVCKKCKKQVGNKSKICRFCGADVSKSKIINNNNNKSKSKANTNNQNQKQSNKLKANTNNQNQRQSNKPKANINNQNQKLSDEVKTTIVSLEEEPKKEEQKENEEILKKETGSNAKENNTIETNEINESNTSKIKQALFKIKSIILIIIHFIVIASKFVWRNLSKFTIKAFAISKIVLQYVLIVIKFIGRVLLKILIKTFIILKIIIHYIFIVIKFIGKSFVKLLIKIKDLVLLIFKGFKTLFKKAKNAMSKAKESHKKKREAKEVIKLEKKKNAEIKKEEKRKEKAKSTVVEQTSQEEKTKSIKQKSKLKPVLITVIIVTILSVGTYFGIDVYGNITGKSKEITLSEKATKEKVFGMDDIINYNGVEYKIVKVEKSEGNNYKAPKEGYEFLIVTIYIKNNTGNKVSYSYENWTMSNSKNEENKRIFTSINVDTALYSGELVIGGIKTGSMVFEQPINDQKLKMNFYELKEDENGNEEIDESKRIFSISVKVPKEDKEKNNDNEKTDKTKETKKELDK